MSESASGSWDAIARTAAFGNEGPEESDLLLELLAFEVAETVYAVPIERVREILRMRPITPVPRVPSVVRGVITIRGEVVEVLDLRERMGMTPISPDRRTRIVVLHGQDGRVTGCLVDRVHEVMRVPEASIHAAAEADMENVSGLCKRGDDFVSMLDLDQVLDLERTD